MNAEVPVIRLDDVTRAYDDGAVVAVRNLSLTIADGDCVAIVGASGSGKSSVINIMSGIDTPTAGRVFWCGNPVTSRRQWAKLRGLQIGVIFQEFNLIPTLTAFENVEMALIGRGLPSAERRERAIAALERVGLGSRMQHQPHALSGGERQRVAIARSIINRPKLVLADEPTGSLDSANGEMIIDLLFDLHAAGSTTLVIVTHDESLARRCNRLIRVKDGRVVEDRASAPVLAIEPVARRGASR